MTVGRLTSGRVVQAVRDAIVELVDSESGGQLTDVISKHLGRDLVEDDFPIVDAEIRAALRRIALRPRKRQAK